MIIEGIPYRNIAKRFGISEASVYRHKNHISKVLIKSKEAKEINYAENLLGQVRDLVKRALNVLSKAEAKEDFRAATGAIREARGCLELVAKMVGELKEGQTVNILISPEWIQMRTVILQALEPYPKAKIAVAESLESFIDGSNST